jgi:hypothetical protein
MRKARLAVHHRSACSGVKALRNTSPARRQAAKLCYRFGPLTPSARSANLIAGDGTRNGFPAPNKEPTTNQKHDLTGKTPYRFESLSLKRRVLSQGRGRGASEVRLVNGYPGRDLVTSKEADAANSSVCADGPAVRSIGMTRIRSGTLGGGGGADRMCASATWTELRGCCP